MKVELDFLIIGAQKSGTTSLFEYLRSHPELYLPPAKEAPYFSHDNVMARGWDAFLRQTFSHADPRVLWGTATPQYMAGAVYQTNRRAGSGREERAVPERIYAQLPNVRLVAVLRDPIDRAFSHYRMMRMRGEESRTFDKAMKTLLRPQELRRARTVPSPDTCYVVWGEYGRILRGYREIFPAEQLHVLLTADLSHAPEREVRRIHEFLGVSPDYLPGNIGERYRQGADARRVGAFGPEAGREAARRNKLARHLWTRTPERVRTRLHHGFERATYAYDLWNRRGDAGTREPSAEICDALRAHFAEDRKVLESLCPLTVSW